MKTSNRLSSSSGFTLIEMLVVIGILAILMAAVTGGLTGAKEQAYKTQARDTARQICQGWNLYLLDNRGFPTEGLEKKDGEYAATAKSMKVLNTGKTYVELTDDELDANEGNGLHDHWGGLLYFRLDEDYDGKVDNPAPESNDVDTFRANVVAWSRGKNPDKKKKWIIVSQ